VWEVGRGGGFGFSILTLHCRFLGGGFSMSEKFCVDEGLVLDGWELREDGWYILEKDGSAVLALPYFKIRRYYLVGRDEDEYVEIENRSGEVFIRKVKRMGKASLPILDLVDCLGDIN
jgi:hypothetical protein